MGCAGSKQEAHKGNKNPGRTRNRYSDSDSPSRAQLPPPKPVKREDAFNHGRPQDSETVPAGWSRSRHVNEPTRSRTDRGSPDRGASAGSTSGFPPTWDGMMNRVADRGDVGGLTKESVEKSLAANLKNEEWMKSNVGSFLNAGKADKHRSEETKVRTTRLGVM